MVNGFSNRIADLLDDSSEPIPIAASRTPAQREASRKNGARSRGPKTNEGKARSSANAFKHGALAKKITPPCDVRADEQMFQKARRSLIHDLQPQTFSQHAAVDSLAHDYVVLARARAMVEAVFKPPVPPLPPGESPEQWDLFQQARKQLRVLESLLAQCESGRRLECSFPDARLIADKLISVTKQLQSEIEEIREEEAAGEFPSDEDDIKVDEECKRLWAMIEPAAIKRFLDRKYLVEILSGTRLAVHADRKRFREFLQELRKGVKLRLADLPEFEKAMQLRADVKESKLAWAPQPLMLLEQYVTRIERSIQRKLNQFLAM
jgi:hypothetical protein